MRPIGFLFSLSFLLLTGSADAIDTKQLLGKWEYGKASDLEHYTYEFKPNGVVLVDGDPAKYVLDGSTLTITEDDDTQRYTVTLKADGSLTIGGGDFDKPLPFKRIGGAAAPVKKGEGNAPAKEKEPVIKLPLGFPEDEKAMPKKDAAPAAESPTGVAGLWKTENGLIRLNPDGTGSIGAKKFRYTVTPNTITLADEEGESVVPYRLDGDRMTVVYEGKQGVITRIDPADEAEAMKADAAAANSVAGVWVSVESSVDPTIVMTHTQYLTLLPDGAVNWSKAEGGATRTRVSDHLERFSSYKTDRDTNLATHGRWSVDGDRITVQWNIWNNLRSEGHIDKQRGLLTLSGMGVIDEGSTLKYERQR